MTDDQIRNLVRRSGVVRWPNDRISSGSGRADRILDATGALLRLGYRKVTIEDVARQAGIGKGTVYLHWRTKDQLFHSLILRESIGLVSETLDL